MVMTVLGRTRSTRDVQQGAVVPEAGPRFAVERDRLQQRQGRCQLVGVEDGARSEHRGRGADHQRRRHQQLGPVQTQTQIGCERAAQRRNRQHDSTRRVRDDCAGRQPTMGDSTLVHFLYVGPQFSQLVGGGPAGQLVQCHAVDVFIDEHDRVGAAGHTGFQPGHRHLRRHQRERQQRAPFGQPFQGQRGGSRDLGPDPNEPVDAVESAISHQVAIQHLYRELLALARRSEILAVILIVTLDPYEGDQVDVALPKRRRDPFSVRALVQRPGEIAHRHTDRHADEQAGQERQQRSLGRRERRDHVQRKDRDQQPPPQPVVHSAGDGQQGEQRGEVGVQRPHGPGLTDQRQRVIQRGRRIQRDDQIQAAHDADCDYAGDQRLDQPAGLPTDDLADQIAQRNRKHAESTSQAEQMNEDPGHVAQ
jgi:hypothetical protein